MAFKNKTSKFNKCPNKNLAFSTIQLFINLDPRHPKLGKNSTNSDLSQIFRVILDQ